MPTHIPHIAVDPGDPPQELSPNDGADPPERISVGGELGRWLNISATITAQGARDPDRAIYMCNVCESNETALEDCSSSNYTQLVIGTPPVVPDTSGNINIIVLCWDRLYCNDNVDMHMLPLDMICK